MGNAVALGFHNAKRGGTNGAGDAITEVDGPSEEVRNHANGREQP